LFDRYGDEAIEYVFGFLIESTDYYGSETIKRLATVSKACAQEMEIYANVGQFGFDYEDIFKAIYLRLNLGEEFNNTVCGNDFNDFESGCISFESLINTYFEPELLKKYGLEVVTEHIIKALNWEIADDFWKYFDADEYPNFLNDLVPLLNEQIAKGSVNAAQVLMKAFRAGKRSYFADVTNFTIPECITEIPLGTFYGCTRLTDITIPAGVTKIGEQAFFGCINLSAAVLPEGLKKIERLAFAGCERLSNVIIPKGVINISHRAYIGCTNLRSVTLPIGVKIIGEDVFKKCDSQETIFVPAKKTEYYKKRLPSELWDKIVELDDIKQ
jgi:hypothetical protein